MLTRSKLSGECGSMLVIFALTLPLVLALGSLTVTVGNWYVHQKRLQTLVDSAALAGGGVFVGCGQDVNAANASIANKALQYAGDTTRSSGTYNLQTQAPGKVHIVLNSHAYWKKGDATNGVGLDNTDVSSNGPRLGAAGSPCYDGYLDVKATDSEAPTLWGWLPFVASPKTSARVEMRQVVLGTGAVPIGVPETKPNYVAAIVVNEDAANWKTNASAVVGAGLLTKTTPSPVGLESFAIWQGSLASVNLNGASDFGVFVLTSRNSTAPSLTGSLDTICNQTPSPASQVVCDAYDGDGTDASFIHAYSDSAPSPAVRQAVLTGGCGTDLSAPYFNLNGGCAMQLQAALDLGVPSGTNPNTPPYCYTTVTSSPGGTMTWAAGGINGTTGTWTSPTYTPAAASGRNAFNITTTKKAVKNGTCSGKSSSGPSFPNVAATHVADDNTGSLQYLWVTRSGQAGAANSTNQSSSANLFVTVGLAPPLSDAKLTDPPIPLRFGSGPSQTQALDCGSGAGPNGWRGKMVTGCDPYSVNTRDGLCTTPYPNPAAPDCIASENGNFNNKGVQDRLGSPCTPNLWNGVTVPPPGGPRWVTVFVLDEFAFTQSGKKTYPIRGFANFYVTAGDGMNCPGDVPSSVNRTELWGHFVTYVSPDPNAQTTTALCTFNDAGTCLAVLVR